MNNVHQIWGAVAIVTVVSGVAVALSLADKDPNTFLTICALVITPIVTALLVRKPVDDVKTELKSVHEDVKTELKSVHEKVNGHLSEITKKIPDATVQNGTE